MYNMTKIKLLNNKDADRIFGLDIYRALAIILVVLGHGGFLLSGTRWSEFPYFKMIDGVDLFFVLSGFLIGSILLKEINANENFGFKALVKFWKRRWLRTLPNYYLILLANYLIVYYGVINEDIHQFNWKFLLFLQNFSQPFYGFFWESWSLSVEEWFYISAPILLLLFLRFISPKNSFILITLLMIVLPFIYRMYIYNPSVDGFWYDVTFRKVILTRLDSIAYGLLAAWVYFYFKRFWDKFKYLSLLAGIGIMIFILNFEADNGSFYKQILYFSLTPISAMFLLPFAQSIKSASGIVAKLIIHISKISYSMYLINLALVAEIIRDNFLPTNEMNGIVKYFLYWLIVLVGSTLLYKYFEKPIMNLRDR